MAQTNDSIAAGAPAASLPGLTEDEVAARRRAGQGNVAPPPTGRSYRQIVVENVFTFINICLFCLGLALAFLGRPADALVSTGVIFLNVVVSVIQEIRAKRMLDRIALLTRPMATVRRAGQEREVSPGELVVGDLVRVGPGDQIVVDGRVAGAGRFNVDESQLTGESDLIAKQAGDTVFSGSFCVAGGGLYVAERVGSQSFTNQITAGARTFRRVLTPLQREIHLVIRIMLLIVVYLQFLLVVNNLLKQTDLADAVQNSSVVAGLVPNGLFVSISVAYALAAVRIIRFGALVQQANAVESLSNVDVLCLDKTGTLTANRLNLAGLHPLKVPEVELRRVIGAVCASAQTSNKTSEAIGAACAGQPSRVVAEVPFSSARKWSALALDDPAGPAGGSPIRGVYALGAPEMLRPYLEPEDWPAIAAQAGPLADQGLRVLLLAHGPDPLALRDEGDDSRLPAGLRPLGLVSLTDELRPDARETLAAFVAAGVRPKIISGDNPETVAALAKQAGLGPDIRLLSGLEIDALDDARLAAAAEDATIFGRITPQQKERLVRVLRRNGHYVAMIGDGVNDVLSLKQANLGIAMQSGSQAARGVADIVLMRDSFAALAPAVVEGQRILNGMEDILRLFLTRIGTIGVLILSALVVGEFPIALRHGSLVTLFSVGIPTVLLAVWARPGPTPKGRMLQRLVHFVLTPTLLTSAIGLILFYGTLLLLYEQVSGGNDNLPVAEYERLMSQVRPVAQTVLASYLVFVGLLLVIFVEPPSAWWVAGEPLSGDKRPAILAGGLMAVFVVMHLIPTLRDAFALSPLGPPEVALIALAVAVWLLLVRLLWRRRLLERFVGVDLGGAGAPA